MLKIKVMFRYLVELTILNHQPNIEKSYNVLIIVSDFKFIIQITKLISFEKSLKNNVFVKVLMASKTLTVTKQSS